MRFFFLFFCTLFGSEQAFVAYALDCGRFGDQLINYMKALRYSLDHNAELLYKPFQYSDQLVLSTQHPPLLDQKPHIVSYYAPIEIEDENFRPHLIRLIKPIHPIKPLRLPKGRILIAMHVRRGGGFDHCQAEAPTKFPPDSYYLTALKAVADRYKNKSLYVHIFTDDRKPKKIIDKLFKQLKTYGIANNVRIGGRTKHSGHDKSVLEDFFHMTQFEVLIRPDSSYSRSAGLLSAPLVEVSPNTDLSCQIKLR